MITGRSHILAKLTALVLLTVTLGGVTPAHAQDYSSDQVAAFASALMEVQTIRKGMKGELQQAENKEERAALRKETQQEMRQAIEEEGLTVDEYQEMAQTLREDDEFWKRVQKHFTE